MKSRGKPATTGRSPGPHPGRRALSLQRPPHPGALSGGPTTSPPARPSPRPDGFRAPRRRPGGGGAPRPRLTCAPVPGAARRGAGRGQGGPQIKLCCSRDGAVVTSSPSGRRGPGFDPAARAVARRALQPPARPPARSGPRVPSPWLRALGSREKRAAVRRVWTPLGKAGPNRVGSALKKCSGACSRVWKVVLGFRGPREPRFQEKTHPTHKQSSGGGRRESFSVWCCLARRSCQRAACSVLCQIMPKPDLKKHGSPPHISSKGLRADPSSLPWC